MKNYLIYVLVIAFFLVPIFASRLPNPTLELRRKRPFVFFGVVVVGACSLIIVLLSFTDGLKSLFDAIMYFIKTGNFLK